MASNHQYGFRENSSTCMALINLLDKISNNIDEKTIQGYSITFPKLVIQLTTLYCLTSYTAMVKWELITTGLRIII